MKDRMPVLFIGHGSPMNAIEDNQYSRSWEKLGSEIKPKAILAVSAHWATDGQCVRPDEDNKQINDMYGFPEELYRLDYKAKGDPELALRVEEMLGCKLDSRWGLDHGVWSVLHRMYPLHDVPVVMLSTDMSASDETLYERGEALKTLRDEGVLILASGNVVHNLSLIDFSMGEKGYPSAERFDSDVIKAVKAKDMKRLSKLFHEKHAPESIGMGDHFRPLFYSLGAGEDSKEIRSFNEGCIVGSLSMTSFIFE